MKGIDTNILIRFLVGDDPRQTKLVLNRFKQAEADNEVLFVPLLVVLETIWVLESVYTVPREDIVDSIEELLLMPILSFESHIGIQGFISSARETRLDLSDILIGNSAELSDCECLLTFDKKASKTRWFTLLER